MVQRRPGQRVAFVVRVSTEEQAKGWSLQAQEADLRDYATRAGYRIARIFREADSGRKPDRPVIRSLIDLAHRGAIDTVLVWRRDRLLRDAARADDLRAILAECSVRIETMMMGPQSDNATTRFVNRQLDIVSQFEVETIIERTLAGKLAAAKQGRWPLATPQGWVKPQGWLKGQIATDLLVDEHVAPKIRRAYTLAAEGAPLRRVAKALGLSSHTTVLERLHNPLYKGEATYMGILVPFRPIVSPELWGRAQQGLNQRKRNRNDERGVAMPAKATNHPPPDG